MLTLGEVKELGLAAAREAAGPEAVLQVAVESGVDELDRPAYHFSFLIDQSVARERPGRVRNDLGLRLSDALEIRGDQHLPILQILDRADWEQRAVA